MKKAQFFLLVVTSLLVLKVQSQNLTIGGSISTNTVWNYDTVKITSDVTILNGVKLTIESGTVVQAQGQYKIDVKGQLVAIGTATSRIIFTANNQAVGWKGIRFDNTLATNDSSKLYYCTINWGRAVSTAAWQDRAGGAIFMYNFSKLEIKNSILMNNYAAAYGGAIALEYNASPRIVNCLIANNSAASTGGAMDIYNLSNPIMINNTFVNNSASSGGALWTYGYTGSIVNCIFYGNTASSDPQIYGTVPNISYSLVQGGFPQGMGIFDTIPQFVNPTIGAGSSYDATTADYSLSSSSPIIDKGFNDALLVGSNNFDVIGKFRFDNQRVDIGAYEYISSTEVCGNISASTTWSGNILLNCNVTVDNGVVLTILPGTKVIATGPYYIDINGRLLAQGTKDNFIEFTAWSRVEGWKGLIFSSVATSNDTSKIEFSKISNKYDISNASYYYGAIHVSSTSKLLIRNNIIFNNSSKYGGISLLYSSAKVIGNLIVHNQSTYYGSGIYITGSVSNTPLILNNTITKNKSTSSSTAYAVYKSGAAPILRNNIVYENEDNTGGHAATDNAITGMDMQYSCVEGGYTGTGNISSSPLFKNPYAIAGVGININNYNYSLQSTSSCIDAGSAITLNQDLPQTDLIGKTRIYSSAIDMGAYEDKSALAVCGTLATNEIWDANIININCNVVIPSGVKVVIAPGTIVNFNGFYSITVLGALQAIGAEGDSIIFTAPNTSVGWDGIRIDDPNESTNDSSIFDYCVFEYAKRMPTTSTLSGGALSLKSCLEIRVTNNRFSNNTVSGSYAYGAAISSYYLHGTDYLNRIFSHNKFTFNTGTYGIIAYNYSNFTFHNNIINNNSSTSGSAFRIVYSGGSYEKNIFTNNNAFFGSLYFYGLYSDYYIYFNNNVVANNQGVYAGGGTISDISPEIFNNTIVNNYSSNISYAGGLYFMGNADANLKNNIIYGNEINGGIAVQLCINDIAADPKMYNNNIQGGRILFSGTGAGLNYAGVFADNIDVDPDFVSPTIDAGLSYNGLIADWSISQGSAIINAGFSNSSSLNISDFDFLNQPRIFNGRIDIGAIENQDPIVAPCAISEDTQWEADTIRVNCDITIQSLAKLTIKPGTVILFTGHYGIFVDGTIESIGTSNDKIQFIRTDTLGFWDSTTTNGGWNGINFNSVLAVNDSSIFSNTIFKYAKAAGATANDKIGAAMLIYNSPKVSIRNCLFSNNFAYDHGGALYIESSNIDFKNNIIANNTAGNGAGGIYLEDFSGYISNNTVVNNKARFYGGFYVKSCEAQFVNNIFWGNYSFYYGTNYHTSQISFQTSPTSSMQNNIVQYGYSRISNGYQLSSYTNNLEANPSMVNPSTGAGYKFDGGSANWNLESSSISLNAGLVGSSSGMYDFAGNHRLVSDTIDIGAYEIQISERFIDLQPVGLIACENSAPVLSTHATVNANYQWQKNGINIPGKTLANLSFSNISLADSGNFNCIISNAYGSISTDTVEVAISLAPSIISSPASTSECLGSSVTFSSTVSGSSPITYQWYNSNGQLQSGNSSQSYTIGNGTEANTGYSYPTPFADYYWGTRQQYLILASELTAQGMVAGPISSLAFNVSALNACPTLSDYSLKIGMTALGQLTTSSWVSGLTSIYSVSSYQSVNGWNSFSFQAPYSWDGVSNIVVEICSNNSFYLTNGNATVLQSITTFNSSHVLYMDALGACTNTGSGIIYQQRPNIKLIAGSASNQSSYVINSIVANDASNYYMMAVNTCGSAQSNGATLVLKYAPGLTPISASASICEDNSYTYSTAASQGTSPIIYQWFKDGSAISGATALTYNITSGDVLDAGIYYCRATNICGIDSTNQSVLAVKEKPQISSQSSSQTICSGQSVTFNVVASGNAPLTYQWYNGSNPISGANNNSYTISSTSSSSAGTYYCKVSNDCVSTPVSSTGIVLTVNTSPSITAQTNTVDICSGVAAPFSVTASGSTPLTYQWYNSSGAIGSATNENYTISAATISHAGSYYCIASNSCGTASSNSIPLTVNSTPTITTQPSSLVKCEGQSGLFNIQSTGTSPITCQWFKGGNSVSGATNQSLLISPISASDASSYYCVATNGCGSINSVSASLTVNSGVQISSQSTSEVLCEGGGTNLQISVQGTTPISYTWYKNQSIVSGAISSSLIISNADTSDIGNYYCTATNLCSSVNSANILMTINSAPSITYQPATSSICENQSGLFNVTASGTSPLSYQWYSGAGAISGATSSSYLIPQVATSNSGSYYVKVTNDCGNITSNSATLTVKNNVSLTAQSSSKTVCAGGSTSFSVTASGSTPITYQWYKNNLPLQSETNYLLNLSSIDTSNAATYHVIASNSCNSIQSNSMILTVKESPNITAQPISGSACVGSSAVFNIAAVGTQPLNYQWYFASLPVTGANSSTYLIGNVASLNSGSYYATVSNSCGTLTTNAASLTVKNLVTISTQSANLTKCVGTSAQFSVTANGTGPISYQWYKNGVAITGAVSSTFEILSVSNINQGDYYCIVSNSCNSVQSSIKTLTVNQSPLISTITSDTTLCSGSNLSLSITASGTAPLYYQWYKGSTAISGAVNASLPLYQISTSDAGQYHCVITNSCGTISSSNINVTVKTMPIISSISQNTTACKNTLVSFNASATGSSPLSYQWYNSSGAITSANSAIYNINSVLTSNAGNYYLVVSNSCGSINSNNISLEVNEPPLITSQSTSATKCVGSAFSFSVSATGSIPLNYQWYNSDGAIIGATSSLYLINSVDTGDADSYYCIVSNSCGNATSTNKVLIIQKSPNFVSQSNGAVKCEGNSMLFTVSANGSMPLSYNWFVDTGAVAGANANSYTINNLTTANAGNYYCVVSNACGSITSLIKSLSVNSTPFILSQTSSDTVCQMNSMAFNVNAGGTNPISCQWYKNSNLIVGAVNNNYLLLSVDTLNAGVYSCSLSNACGTVQSAPISLTINKLAKIVFQSADSSRCEGQSVQLISQATGTLPINYQWFKGNQQVNGANSYALNFNNLDNADGGNYYCNVENICNSINSTNKQISVHINPKVDLGNDTSFCLGGQTLLTPGFGFNCLWSNGSFNNQISVSQSGNYWVNVTDQYGCSGHSDTVNVNVVLPFGGTEICMAGVDSATQKNVIVWEKTPNLGISSFNIYRESSVTGVWNLIENKPFDSLSVVFDLTSNPLAHADRYIITAIDSCQNESNFSPAHKTIHLAVSQAVPSGFNLLWSAYQGFQVASYRIWKADSTMKWNLVDSVNGNIFMWHDTTTIQKPFWYQIEVIRPGGACNPTKANTNYNTSRSNQASNGLSMPNTLVSNFIATPTQGIAPLVVVFYDQTLGAPTNWYWNFGDGTTSILQNPAHQYDSAGIYDVTLTVMNSDGVNSVTKFGFIDVLPDGISELNPHYQVAVFPNPYSNKTNIEFTLYQGAEVEMEVFSALGQHVKSLEKGRLVSGNYRYEFSAKENGFAEGVYFLRLNVDGKQVMKKLVEVK
jgi:hypothetical protein